MKKSNSQKELIIDRNFKILKENKERNEMIKLELELYQIEYPEGKFIQDDCFIGEDEWIHYIKIVPE